MKKLLLAAAAVLALLGPAQADYNITTPITAPPNTTLQSVRAGGGSGSPIINYQSPIDATGAAFGTVGNPFALQFGTGILLPGFAAPPTVNLGTLNGAATATLQQSILTALGSPLQAGGSVSIGGTLPQFATAAHFICDSGCSGGGGGNVNLTQILGAAPSLTNPLWITPATGATFAVSGTFWQTTQPVSLTSTTITGSVAVTGTFFQATQPISAASLPLPTGAATSALQTTGNTSLSSIDTKTPALGQALAAASTPVVLTAIQVTALTPPAAITNFALETGGNLATIATNTGRIPAQGQALAVASLPVVLTALQVTALTPPTTVAVTQATAGSLNATVVGTGTFAVQLSGATNNINNIAGTISLPTGAATAALQTTGNTSLASILTALGSPFQAAGALGAGSAIIGNVRIDQTTPATTNGVSLVPNSATAGAITPVPSTSAESGHVLKASAGSAYSAAATNQTATAGYLVLINATSVPADGAITPLACAPLPANGSASVNYGDFPAAFSTGIVAVVSSSGSCFTKTTGVITAFLSGQVK